MKNILLACFVSLTAIAPAIAQISKNDFYTQITEFRAEHSRPFTDGAMATTRDKIVGMMNQQIDYVTKKCNDNMLNMQCDQERRQKVQNPGACNQLQQYNTTLASEKNYRDAVNSVMNSAIANKADFLIQQFTAFYGTL